MIMSAFNCNFALSSEFFAAYFMEKYLVWKNLSNFLFSSGVITINQQVQRNEEFIKLCRLES